MTSAASSDVGASVAGYRIERRLGHGETGAVYLAERDGRRVALRTIAPELCRSPRFRQRFAGDCRLLMELDHSNVLPVYDAGEVDGVLYIAMQYVHGADLGSMLRDGPLSAEQAVGIVEQVAAGLHAAHSCGLVHRDLEPSNILLEAATHQVYITGFGLTGRTTDFAAPERIDGERLDGRADVYSLGCVLAACLGGELWPELERVVAKARTKDPADRYTTTVEHAEAARSALTTAPAPEPRPEPPSRRNLVAAVAAIMLVAGAAAALVTALGGGHSAVPSPPFTPRVAAHVGATLAVVDRALAAIPVQAEAPAVYDVVANTGGVGVRYRSTPALWCGDRPQTDPCWRTVVPGTGAAEGQQLRVFCYAPGASVHGDAWWAKVSVNPDEYVPTAFLRSAVRYSSIAPPTSLRC